MVIQPVTLAALVVTVDLPRRVRGENGVLVVISFDLRCRSAFVVVVVDVVLVVVDVVVVVVVVVIAVVVEETVVVVTSQCCSVSAWYSSIMLFRYSTVSSHVEPSMYQ